VKTPVKCSSNQNSLHTTQRPVQSLLVQVNSR